MEEQQHFYIIILLFFHESFSFQLHVCNTHSVLYFFEGRKIIFSIWLMGHAVSRRVAKQPNEAGLGL